MASSKIRPALLLAGLALVAGGLAWWLRPQTVPAPLPNFDPTEAPKGSAFQPPLAGVSPEATGGVYAGVVVDSKGDPVRDADVLLAGKRSKKIFMKNPILEQAEDLEIQQLDYETVARVKTDAQGRFRAAAGDATVVALFAVERSRAPGMVSANPPGNALAPGPNHRIVLPDAGWLKGRVVDAVTKDPVRGADVSLNLQSRSSQGGAPGPEPWTERNGFAAFQGYVAHELAPIVWDAAPIQGDPAIHRYTATDGTFSFGPVMSEVQLEVVVTHPEYAWEDFDEEVVYKEDNSSTKPGAKPLGRKRRLVVQPGQTVERAYALHKGQELKGRVLDPAGAPIADVDVQLSHIAQYAQHSWFRDHYRTAKTDAEGRFRIAGLSFPPYSLHMSHDAFGTADFPRVEPGDEGTYTIQQSGWIEGKVEGGTIERPLYEARVSLDPYSGLVARATVTVTVRDGKFTALKIPAGKYAVTLTAGPWISAPADVVVESGKPSTYVARLSVGGTIALSAVDSHRLPIDPMTADLELVGTDGRSLRGAGSVVGRKGVATATTLSPGRYRARVRAPWYIETVTEPFDVGADRTTSVGPVTLHKQGWVRIQSVKDEAGQSPQDVRLDLAIAQGGQDYVPTRTGDAGLIPVSPGTVKVRAKASDGRTFEQTYEVGEGETVAVDIRIAK